jgi:hypothetical protein
VVGGLVPLVVAWLVFTLPIWDEREWYRSQFWRPCETGACSQLREHGVSPEREVLLVLRHLLAAGVGVEGSCAGYPLSRRSEDLLNEIQSTDPTEGAA